MKIISKFHDYYDSAASFYDDSILLKRKTEIIDKKDIAIKLPYQNISVAHSYKRGLKGNYQERSANIEILYFCGKVYPIYTIFTKVANVQSGKRYDYSYEKLEQIYFSTFSEFIKAIEDEDLKVSYGIRRKNDFKAVEEKIEKMKTYEVSPEIFEKMKSPYFISREIGKENKIEIFPELKEVIKSFKMDAYIAYQEIEMYLSGVLGSSEKEIIEISDIDKRNSKGFDDYSFKKRKAQ